MNRSRDYAGALLRKARADAWMMAQLIGKPEAPDWGLGFHAQQAVEKAIKAVLTAHDVEYPHTHDLKVLLNLLQARGLPLPPDAPELGALTPFAAPLRYDSNGLEKGQPLDRLWLQGCVDRTLGWAGSPA